MTYIVATDRNEKFYVTARTYGEAELRATHAPITGRVVYLRTITQEDK